MKAKSSLIMGLYAWQSNAFDSIISNWLTRDLN